MAGDLLAAAKGIGAGDRLTSWWVQDGQLHVGLSSLDGSEAQKLTSKLHTPVVTSVEPTVYSMVKRTHVSQQPSVVAAAPAHSKGGPATASSTATASATAASTDPRLIDATPYYAGDRITSFQGTNTVVQCTAGGKVLASSTPAMLTAGHCGPAGTLWYQGYWDSTAQTLYESGTMGTAATVSWGNNRVDGETLTGGSYANGVWLSSTSAASITGSGTAYVGTSVCTDGSFTFLSCGGTVDQTNVCVNLNDNGTVVTVCGLDRAVASHRLVQSGDSGGPVLMNLNGQTTQLAGLISGGSSDGLTVWFSMIDQVDSTLGVSVATS